MDMTSNEAPLVSIIAASGTKQILVSKETLKTLQAVQSKLDLVNSQLQECGVDAHKHVMQREREAHAKDPAKGFASSFSGLLGKKNLKEHFAAKRSGLKTNRGEIIRKEVVPLCTPI